jgi:predicted HicB family RNase H-like nuclease
MDSTPEHGQIEKAAEALFERKPDWIQFYREILGLHGAVRRRFNTMESLATFKQSDTYAKLLRMVTQLRSKAPGETPLGEATKIITVRIPKSLHDALRIEAFEHRTSMNKLCISKLLQFIDEEQVPAAVEVTAEVPERGSE